MATVKEIMEKYEGEYTKCEVYAYTDKSHRLHGDYIANIDEEYDLRVYWYKEVLNFELMDEEQYNSTILANTSVNFADTHNSDDKILVIVLAEDWNEFVVVAQSYLKGHLNNETYVFEGTLEECIDRKDYFIRSDEDYTSPTKTKTSYLIVDKNAFEEGNYDEY